MKRKPTPPRIRDLEKRASIPKTKPYALHKPSGYSKLARGVLKHKGLWLLKGKAA